MTASDRRSTHRGQSVRSPAVRRGTVRAVDGVSLRPGAGEDPGAGRRVGERQEHALPGHSRLLAGTRHRLPGRDGSFCRSRTWGNSRKRSWTASADGRSASCCRTPCRPSTRSDGSAGRSPSRCAIIWALPDQGDGSAPSSCSGRSASPSPRSGWTAIRTSSPGGCGQRVAIAIALACDPQLLIADEPTTALDVTVQAEILNLLARLQRERNMAMILVTHDLGVVAGRAHETAVMYAGRIVEQAPTAELFASMRMHYTRALFDAIPRIDDPPHTGSQDHRRPAARPGGTPCRGAGSPPAARGPRSGAARSSTPLWRVMARTIATPAGFRVDLKKTCSGNP